MQQWVFLLTAKNPQTHAVHAEPAHGPVRSLSEIVCSIALSAQLSPTEFSFPEQKVVALKARSHQLGLYSHDVAFPPTELAAVERARGDGARARDERRAV